MTARPDFYRFHNGQKASLQFSVAEYEARVAGLRASMEAAGVSAAVLTSIHNVSYYSGFTYCAFGRPYGVVVTATDCVTISAGIDAGQPWRRCFCDNITYTDWQRDNYWRAIFSVTGPQAVVGIEEDHLTALQAGKLATFLAPTETVDLATATMQQRMSKSPAEISLIRAGAQVADVGGYAIREAIREGVREIDVAMAGRDAMEMEIAQRFPEAGLELREDVDTVLEPGMVISMEPMLTIADGNPGSGGYREHDILLITNDGNENITGYPYGPEFNVVG